MKKIQIEQKLSDKEIERYCKANNLTFIMSFYDVAENITTLTVI